MDPGWNHSQKLKRMLPVGARVTWNFELNLNKCSAIGWRALIEVMWLFKSGGCSPSLQLTSLALRFRQQQWPYLMEKKMRKVTNEQSIGHACSATGLFAGRWR